MPTKAHPFPEWLPDQANNILSKAVNVRPIANGYAPVRDFNLVAPALASEFLGGGSFINSEGSTKLLAADTGIGLLSYDGSIWTDVISLPLSARWYFAQFGDNVITANGAPIRSFNLVTNGTSLPADGPNLIDVCRARDFVMGITDDNKVRWSQFNDSGTWTIGANQADEQPILDSSGVRIIGGEYAILLKRQGITRISYVGAVNDIIFQFDEIAPEVGCMAAGSVCNMGRMIFFLSERGFQMCDGATVTPIGDEKFNRWFFNTYSRADIDEIWGAVDPRNSSVVWAMPGTPGRLITYNWVLQRASVIEMDVTGLFTGYTSPVSLESLDAIYGDLDSIPVSLDSPAFSGGNPLLMVVNADYEIGQLGGDTMQAVLKLDNIEPAPGKRARIRSLRLISDAIEGSATIDARMREGDAEGVVSAATMRTNGKMPIRSNGRYNSVEVTIPAGADWNNIQGLEIEFDAGDGR